MTELQSWLKYGWAACHEAMASKQISQTIPTLLCQSSLGYLRLVAVHQIKSNVNQIHLSLIVSKVS